MRHSKEIVLASGNRSKFFEFSDFFRDVPGVTLTQASKVIRNLDSLGAVETFDTYAENALAKARFANHACHAPCLSDDSGLEVEALKGQPGPRSARNAEPRPRLSQSESNVLKLLEELKGHPLEKRRARFICNLGFVMEGVALVSEGVLEGTIAEDTMGSNGFGYDPVFIPQGSNKTLAQMPSEEKNRISHRYLAFQDLIQQMRERGIILAKP